MSGFGAFREAYLNADTLRAKPSSAEFDAYNRWDARQLRYDLLWSFYQNNAFWEGLHGWAPGVKQRFSLYKNTRQIFNPTYRLGEFWATHIAGGTLDRDAGDGSKVKSALPIEGASPAVRKGLAKLWRDSRFAILKDDWGRKGAVLGDVGLLACDDPIKGRVTLRLVHPGHLKWLATDCEGRCTGYIIEEMRYDPRRIPLRSLSPSIDPNTARRTVVYNEEAWVEGGRVKYRTFLNYGPYDWRLGPDGEPLGDRAGALPEWDVPYDFIPFHLCKHLDVGLTFGVSEPHALLSKVLEVDDVASNQGDQIRRILNAPWAILGTAAPGPAAGGGRNVPSPQGSTPTPGNPQSSRSEASWFYFSGEHADVKPMVADMPLEEVGKHVDRINTEIERDYPELRFYLMNEVGDTSGRALRVARQATEAKVQTRRTGYDEGLAAVQKMALAIGSIRGYEGYDSLGAEHPDDPSIDHAIAHRPVFSPDPLDDIEEGTAFWTMVNAAVGAGVPLEVILEREGWAPTDVSKIVETKRANADEAMDRVSQRMAAAGAPDPTAEVDVTPDPTDGEGVEGGP